MNVMRRYLVPFVMLICLTLLLSYVTPLSFFDWMLFVGGFSTIGIALANSKGGFATPLIRLHDFSQKHMKFEEEIRQFTITPGLIAASVYTIISFIIIMTQ